jgi:hypothetical protein
MTQNLWVRLSASSRLGRSPSSWPRRLPARWWRLASLVGLLVRPEDAGATIGPLDIFVELSQKAALIMKRNGPSVTVLVGLIISCFVIVHMWAMITTFRPRRWAISWENPWANERAASDRVVEPTRSS